MMASRPLLRILPIVMASLCATAAMGCASANPAPADDGRAPEGEVGSSEDEVRASCSNPRKYFATLQDGATCQPVAAQGGRWLPEPLFGDAPSTCAYRWSGVKGARPDRQPLLEVVGFQNGVAPACGSGADAGVGNVRSIPDIDFTGQAGSVGCDVCGVVKGKIVFVILPPEKILLKQFSVGLSNGKQRSFQIESGDARALSVTLPPPPAGTKYLQGHVKIL